MSCPVRVRESLVDFGNGDTGDDSPCEIAQDRLSDHSDSANSMERSAHEAKQSARVVGDGKRKRQPRTRFVEWQLRLLINSFRVNPLPDRGELADIAAATRLSINVVRVWFQNRRRNEKVAGTRHATSPVHKTYGQVPTFHFLNPLQGPTATSGVYDLAMSASNQGQLYLPKPATEVIGGLRYQSAPLQAVDQTTQAIYIPAAAYGTSTSTLLACPATESTSSIAVGTTSKLMMASSPSKTHFYSGSKARAEKYSTDGDEYVDSDETSAQFATSPAFHILPTKVKTPVSPENLQIDSEGFDNQVECNSEGSLKQAANNCEQGLADSPQLPPLLSSACQGTGPSSIGGKLHSPSPMNLSSETLAATSVLVNSYQAMKALSDLSVEVRREMERLLQDIPCFTPVNLPLPTASSCASHASEHVPDSDSSQECAGTMPGLIPIESPSSAGMGIDRV